jgi:hypothetical protein
MENKSFKTHSEVCTYHGLSIDAMHSRANLIWPISPFNIAKVPATAEVRGCMHATQTGVIRVNNCPNSCF